MISGTDTSDKTTGDKSSSVPLMENKNFCDDAEKVGSETLLHILSKWSIWQAGQKLLYRTWLTKFRLFCSVVVGISVIPFYSLGNFRR